MQDVEVNIEKGESDEEKKEYLINTKYTNYKLLIIINYQKETIELKINENSFMPKYIYSNLYNFKEMKSLLKLGDIYNNDQIVYFFDDVYSKNKIYINDEDFNIKLVIKIPNEDNKTNESILILNKKDLDINEKFELIINEINCIKKNNIALIDKKFEEIFERLNNMESSMDEKIKNNTGNLNSLNKEINDKILKNNQDTILSLKKEFKEEIDDLKKVILNQERKEKPKEIKKEEVKETLEELNIIKIEQKNENINIDKNKKENNINIKKDNIININDNKNNINEIKNKININNEIISINANDNKNKIQKKDSSKNNPIKKKGSIPTKFKIEKLYEPDDDYTNVYFFIMLIGESGVGKTWIFDNYFSLDYAQSPSLGIESEEIFFKINDISLISLNIGVSPGDKKFNQINFCSNKDLIIFVYAIDDRKSFENLKGTIKEVKKNRKDTYYILVGNKIDLESKRVVKREEGENLAKNENLNSFFECSAKNGNYIENIFLEACKILYINKVVNG